MILVKTVVCVSAVGRPSGDVTVAVLVELVIVVPIAGVVAVMRLIEVWQFDRVASGEVRAAA